MDFHRSCDTADGRIEIIAIPEKSDPLPVSRSLFILRHQIGARLYIRLVRRFCDTQTDISRCGIICGDCYQVFFVIVYICGDVEAEWCDTCFVVAGHCPIDIEIAGLAHALKFQQHLVMLMLFRYCKIFAIKGKGAFLTASGILDSRAEQITIIKGVWQCDVLPILFVIVRLVEIVPLIIPPFFQSVL